MCKNYQIGCKISKKIAHMQIFMYLCGENFNNLWVKIGISCF